MAGPAEPPDGHLPLHAGRQGHEAAAWLTRARRRIEADVWEPERIVKRKAKDTALTFGEYAAKWLETRAGQGLHVNTIYGSDARSNGSSMHSAACRSARSPRPTSSAMRPHCRRTTRYVGRELLSKLRQILDAAATPDEGRLRRHRQ